MSKGPCECGSSDGKETYDDGHSYCFVCHKYETAEGKSSTIATDHIKPMHLSSGAPWLDGERSIPMEVGEYYGVTCDAHKHYYPYYDIDGKHVANKVRITSAKDFYAEGKLSPCQLFGQHLAASGGKRIVITEGELDAMSAYAMLDKKFPVVSLKNGASAAYKECKENLEFLESFDTIFIAFDMDAVGQEAAKTVAPLFSTGKVRIMNMTHGKDANDYMADGLRTEFQVEFWRSPTYRPDGIIAGVDLWDDVSSPILESDVMYPWDGLNELTYGVRAPQLISIAAGSGLGKSTILRKLQHHLLMNTKDNIGLMMLEESTRDTALGIMSMEIERPLHLPTTTYTPEEFKLCYEDTVGSGRVFMYDSFGSNGIDNILSRARYFVKALDCKYIMLDHVSIVVSDGHADDERKALDEIMTKLRMLVQELNITMFLVSHLRRPTGKGHEEGAITSLGQLRGSAAIGQLSDIVIGLERDGQADDDIVRNTTLVRVLKNRFSGLTGPACSLYYDKNTGCLTELVEDTEF